MGAGVPDIYAGFWANMKQGVFLNEGSGAAQGMYVNTLASKNVPVDDGSTWSGNNYWSFSASRVSAIYGSSATVTPESLKTGFYIKF